jgi:hypothetical protein
MPEQAVIYRVQSLVRKLLQANEEVHLKPLKDGSVEVYAKTAKAKRVTLIATVLPKAHPDSLAQNANQGAFNYARTTPRDLKTIKELGLPLYWHEETLKKLLDKHGSYEAVAQHLGLGEGKGMIIAQYASRVFGWKVKPPLTETKEKVLKAYFAKAPKQRPSFSELAKRFNTSRANTKRWIDEANK